MSNIRIRNLWIPESESHTFQKQRTVINLWLVDLWPLFKGRQAAWAKSPHRDIAKRTVFYHNALGCHRYGWV